MLIVIAQVSLSVISSNPPCKDVNAQFTTVPLKDFSNQVFKCKQVITPLKR